MRYLLLACLAALAACGDPASPESAAHPRELVPDQNRLRTHVGVLAADTMCGRGAGSLYERSAGNYLRDAFAADGLTPAGDEDFFQEFLIGPIGPSASNGAAAPERVSICDPANLALSRNVLGALPGEGSLATEWVVIGAHYDHVGWELEADTALIYNGADDNASGTALLLEAAHLLSRFVDAHSGMGPRRSILFSGYGAEELGLVGSRYFTANPTIPLNAVTAMVNLDMVGNLRENQLIIGGGASASAWPELLRAAVPDDLGLAYDPTLGERSDLFGFLQRGIPAVHLFTGLHELYHAPGDDVAEVNFRGMELIGRLAVTLLWELATRSTPLTAAVSP